MNTAACQLWNPWNTKDIRAIKAIKRTFTYKITEGLHINYRERFPQLKLYFIRIRRQCYIIFYIWKITYGAKYVLYNGAKINA